MTKAVFRVLFPACFRRAFTILEMLVAMSVLALLLALMVGVFNQAASTIQRSTAQADAFSASRSAFDLLTRRLSQATLNPYWDYDNATTPTRYLRQSDLHFVVRQNTKNTRYGQELFFQSPEAYSQNSTYQSASSLLNACGYRILYDNDDAYRPNTVTARKWRYRLMQSLQPAENLRVYDNKSSGSPPWIEAATSNELPVADNIIALIVWPRLPVGDDPDGRSLSPNYLYDSRKDATINPQPSTANQLPPVAQVTIVTISETAANRLDTKSGTPPADIESALAGKFTTVANYKRDLDDLSSALSSKNIPHQIFTTSVVLRESKWSQ